MPRSCTDGRIDGATSNNAVFSYVSPKDNRVVARGSDLAIRSCYAWGKDTSNYVEMGRYDAAGAWTRLARGYGGSTNGAFAFQIVGTTVSGSERIGFPGMMQVTDSVYSDPGDWRVQVQYPSLAWETAFECYDAPAPSGPKHRVIGSGIVNSRAIVRGGHAW